MAEYRLVTLAPGHFHAALIQKEMFPGVDPRVHVYAPLDTDLTAHLQRIVAFNSRDERPTSWMLEVHSGEDWPERFLRERPGTIAVLSGRNRTKIDFMRLALEAGMHVLADKPWIIDPEDMPKLQAALEKAERSKLLIHDIMTERHEITSILQREIVDDPDLFGIIERGDAASPGIFMESVHYLQKNVAGVPLRRPGWFFDISQQGEALSDVGTHLVDLVLWMLFTDEPIDYRRDVQIVDARHWPTPIEPESFQAITGLSQFPLETHGWLNNGRLDYFCNNQVIFTLRGIHVRLDVLWDLEAPRGGGDTHNAVFRGSRCSAVVRQAGGKPPELFVIPNSGLLQATRERLFRLVDRWQTLYPGVRAIPVGDDFHIQIPDGYRTGHEAHFAEVTAEFLKLINDPAQRPEWETPNLLAKYFITTSGVEFARRESV